MISIGDKLQVESVQVLKKKTKPPPRFTEHSLLEAMCNVHLTVKDADLRAVLDQTNGLGTERTRGDMIDKNIKEGYLAEEGQYIVPSQKTRVLMPYIVKDVKDPILTAKWESVLKKIAEGSVSYEQFMQAQSSIVKELVGKILGLKINSEVLEPLRTETPVMQGHGKSCPNCQKGVLMTRVNSKTNKTFLGCSLYKSDGCEFSSNAEID